MKQSNDAIENRTRDLPTCSAVPQPTAIPRAPIMDILFILYVETYVPNYTVLRSTRFNTLNSAVSLNYGYII